MPRLNPKIALGLIIAFFTLCIAVLIIFRQQPKSTILIEAKENKTYFSFDIKKQDLISFNEFIQKLSIDKKIHEGFNLELDSTSSAKLALYSPITSELSISQNNIKFTGKLSYPYKTDARAYKIKIPAETNIVLFSKDLTNFIKSRFGMPSALNNLISEKTKSQEGQYVVIYGQRPEAVLIFKNENNLDSFKLNAPKEELMSIENQIQDISTVITQYKDTQTGEEKTAVIFEIDDLTFLTNSQESAQRIVKTYKESLNTQIFPNMEKVDNVSFILNFKNDDITENQQMLKFFLDQDTPNAAAKEKIAEILAKSKELNFILEKEDFSGLIKIK